MKGYIIGGFLIIAMVAGTGAGGYVFAKYQDRQEALSQNCAHYDMKTGDFTWGSAGIYLMGGSNADDAAEQVAEKASIPAPPKPQRKPAVSKHGG